MIDFVERIVHEIFYSILALLFAIRIYVDWFGLGKNRDNSLTKAAHFLSFLITLIKVVEGIDGRGVHGIYSQEVGEILSRCVFCLLVVSGLIMFDYTIGVFYKIAASQAPLFWRYLYAIVAAVNVCAVNAFSVVYALLPGKSLLIVWHLWVAGMTFLFVLCITIPFLLSRRSILRLGAPALRFIQSKLDLLFIFFMLFDLFLLFVVLLQILWALRVWGVLPVKFASLTEQVFSISWNVAHFLMICLSLGWSFPVLKLCSCWGAEESWDAISSVGTLTGTPQSKSSQSLSFHTEKRKKQSQSRTSAFTSKSRTTNLMGRETVVRECDDFFDRPASAEAAGFTIDTLTKKETTEIASLFNSMILPSLVSMKRNGIEIPDFPSSGAAGDETPRNLTFRPSQRSPLSSPAHVVAMLMKDNSEVSRPQSGFPKWGKRGTREPASPTLASMPESPQDVDDEPSDQSGQSPKSDIRQESGASVPPLLLDSSTFSRTSSFSPSVSDTPTGQGRSYIEVEPSPSSLPSISEEERKESDYKENKEAGFLRITVRVDEKYQTPSKKSKSSLTTTPHDFSQDSPSSPSTQKPEPFSFATDPMPPGLIGQQQHTTTIDNPPPLETPFTPKRYSYRPSPGQSRIRPSLIELTNKTPKRKPLIHKQPITSSISSTSTTSTQPTIPDEEERDEYRNSLPIFNPFGV